MLRIGAAQLDWALNVSTEARPLIEAYQTNYNVGRPHIALGNISRNEYTLQGLDGVNDLPELNLHLTPLCKALQSGPP